MKMLGNLSGKRIILASASPRRQQLLKGLELEFEVKVRPTDESFDDHLRGSEIPLHVASAKADAFNGELGSQDILITADTIVWIDNSVMNKPADREEAVSMISRLSGRMHQVYTAVCIRSTSKQVSFVDETQVHFSKLSQTEIEHYVDVYKPFDKAGAYGAQDWVGFVGIRKLDGSYFNVMGLPVHLLYEELRKF